MNHPLNLKNFVWWYRLRILILLKSKMCINKLLMRFSFKLCKISWLWKYVNLFQINTCVYQLVTKIVLTLTGGVAQMVERSLSMREVPGSMPGASSFFSANAMFFLYYNIVVIIFNKFIYIFGLVNGSSFLYLLKNSGGN